MGRMGDRYVHSPFADWLRAHDRGHAALRRAARAAIVMPALFAVGDKVIGNPSMSYFLAFGSFAMLLLVDFGGSLLDRVRAQALLGVACSVLICLGTLSSVFASATTALLLSMILPLTVPGPASQIPDRVAGWGLAAAVSLLAITLLWPAPVVNPIRSRAVELCRALAARLRAEVVWIHSDGESAARNAYESAIADADGSVEALHGTFFATPYRPTGLSTDARAVIRLVDELRWLDRVVLRAACPTHQRVGSEAVCEVKLGAAAALEQAAVLLHEPRRPNGPLADARRELREALLVLERETTNGRPVDAADPLTDLDAAQRVVSALDPASVRRS
jgi:hypothetical protein